MISELFKAFLVGICAAVPVGPVLLLVIQKTLCHGRNAGAMTGLGSAVADTLYAAAGVFTLSLVQGYVNSHSALIMLIGGIFIALIGGSIFLRKVSLDSSQEQSTFSLVGCSLQSCGSALSNPAALAVMMALLSSFGIYSGRTESPTWLILLGVFAGELFYWTAVVCLISRFIRFREGALQTVSKLAGVAIVVFAVVLMVKGIVAL